MGNEQSDIPESKGTDDAILRGDVVITERCPECGARWAYPTGDVLTCGDCYSEFPSS